MEASLPDPELTRFHDLVDSLGSLLFFGLCEVSDLMHGSPLGLAVHGILQAKRLEWAATSLL